MMKQHAGMAPGNATVCMHYRTCARTHRSTSPNENIRDHPLFENTQDAALALPPG